MRKFTRRILIALGITATILLIAYIGRRPFFESMILGKAEQTLEALLGVEASVGALKGDWLSSLVIEGVDLRGGPDSAYREITDVDIVVTWSLWSLMSDGLQGLKSLTIRGQRVELDTAKQWTVPTDEPTAAGGDPVPLADLLAMFGKGVKVEIGEFAVTPEYLAPNRTTITLAPGTGRRTATIESGDTSITAAIQPSGAFEAKVKGNEGGRLLRALEVKGVVSRGEFEANVSGTTNPFSLESNLSLKTSLESGSAVGARYEVTLRDGQLRAPMIDIDLPGFQVTGNDLNVPVDGLSRESLRSLLGSLRVKVTDLLHYEALLPPQLKRFLPITGDLGMTLDKGTVKLSPSSLRGKGFELEIQRGSISLVGVPKGELTLEKMLGAEASGLGFELNIPEPVTIEIPNSEPIVLAGRVAANASGKLENLDADAEIDLRALGYGEFEVGSVKGRVRFDGKRVSLTEAKITGARRKNDKFTVGVAGTAAFDLPAGDVPARVELGLQIDAPSAALSMAGLSEDLIATLELPKVTVNGSFALPKDGSLPIGTVKVDAPGLTIRDVDRLNLACEVALETGRVIRVTKCTIQGEHTDLATEGTIDLKTESLDVVVRGHAARLRGIMRMLKQPELEGRVDLGRIHAKGPIARPQLDVVCAVKLTEISPDWFGARANQDVPKAPLDLSIEAASAGETFDVRKLDLTWGQPDRRVAIRSSGPVPLKWTDAGLGKTVRPEPFRVTIDASVDQPRKEFDTGTVTVKGGIELDAESIRVPSFTAKSKQGSLETRNVNVAIGLPDILTKKVDWTQVAVAAELDMREFWLGNLTKGLPARGGKTPAKVTGTIDGDVKVTGRIGKPTLDGKVSIREGGVFYEGLPGIEEISGTASFRESKIQLDYRARTSGQQPLTIKAALDTGELAIWEAIAQDAALNATLRIDGLDLSLLQPELAMTPQLRGHVSLDGTLRGSLKKPEPEVKLTLRDAGWKLPKSENRVQDLRADVQLTRNSVRITEFRGRVPGLDLSMSVDGIFAIEGGAALWEFVTDANPSCRGSLEFKDIPIALLPRADGVDAAKGILGGNLLLAGTWADLRPTLKANLRRGELKLESLPRVDALNVVITANHAGATVDAKAEMGAGPVTISAKLTPGEKKKLLDAYAAGSIDATVKGERVLVTRSGGLKVRGDIDLTAKGKLERIDIGGTIALHDSKYVKRLSLVPDLKVTSGASAGKTFGPWAIEGGERLIFDVAVKTKKPFVVRTNVLDTDLDVNCRLKGQGNAMTLAGACTSRTGTIRFPGMSMRISAMRLMFRGNAPPEIVVVASGQRHGVRLNMRLDGDIDSAVPKLSSSPALQPRDLWSLVTTGARPEALASNSAASNTAILATYVIQELVLTYFASESTEASESFVSRFTFEFGRELSRNGAETWEVNFDMGELWVIPPRFGMRFERDVYEDFNLGLVYRWRF